MTLASAPAPAEGEDVSSPPPVFVLGVAEQPARRARVARPIRTGVRVMPTEYPGARERPRLRCDSGAMRSVLAAPIVVATLTALALAGCTSAPEAAPPSTAIPSTVPQGPAVPVGT